MTATPPVAELSLQNLRLLPWQFRLVVPAMLLASLLTLGLSEFTLRAARNDGAQVTRVLERLAAANRFMTSLIDVETAQRGYLLLGDARYLEPFQRAMAGLEPTSLALRRLVPAGSPLSRRLDRVDLLTTQRLGIVTATLTLAGSGQREAALDLIRQGQDRQLMDDIRAEMEAFGAESRQELATLQNRQGSAADWSRLALLISTVFAVALLVIVTRLAVNQAVADDTLRVRSAKDADRMQDIIASRTAQLANLSSHLQIVSEKEKAELARNLHDEMGGLLTAARMDLSWLQGAAAGRDPAVLEKLQQLSEALAQAMDVKRRVVESLRPALLDHFGLPTALQNHFDETCRKAGLTCITKIPEDMSHLPDEVAIALFRVGQESLTNILRHAKAKTVHLEIETAGDDLTLMIRDDGVGMDTTHPGTCGSYGLAGMRHRIEGLGGRFDLKSRLGAGTEITICLPARRPADGLQRSMA